ncbi:MAG: hypothetical protein ACRD96_28795, partial [Bryobacteraceae bacterium]
MFLRIGILLAATAAACELSLEDKEIFLRNAKMIDSRELSMGITNSRRAVLDDGKLRHDAHIQTVNLAKAEFEGNRGKEINFRDTYKFNIAGYELAKLLGLECMVPPSIERRVAGNSAAVTWWVDNTMMTELDRNKKKLEAPDPVDWNRQMHIVRVFDQLIFNTDRNLGNMVITKDWKIWMIDHTRAFRMLHTLQTPKNLVQIDRKLLARLRDLNKADAQVKLKGWLNNMEIDGL